MYLYNIWPREIVLVPNTSTSLQATLAAEVHLSEGQFLLEEQALDVEMCLVYRVGQ
jgi:hypothetical protein